MKETINRKSTFCLVCILHRLVCCLCLKLDKNSSWLSVSLQALIEREQLREELENMRGRFEEHVAQMQKTIDEESEMARREGQGTREQLETRVRTVAVT